MIVWNGLPTLCAWIVVAVICLGPWRAGAAGPSVLDRLIRDNRHTLTVHDGRFGGDGAAFLRAAIDGAQFVAIGEQHGTQEIPAFATALCAAMSPHGLDAVAVEAGQVAIDQLAPWTLQRDGVAAMAKAEAKTPDFVAFFNWRQDFDFLRACQAASGRHVALWGLDQEFLGAPAVILQHIADQSGDHPPGKLARAALARCRALTAASLASRAWQDGCMFKLADSTMAGLREAASQSGDAGALALAMALIKTRHIYTAHERGHAYDANRERALLLKQNFLADERQDAASLGRIPRVLLKFGQNHLYRGFDMTNLADLGNFLTELADGAGATSLHIAIIGMRGSNAENAGPGMPSRVASFQADAGSGEDFRFMKPFFDQSDAHAMTMYDVRPFRRAFSALGHLDREMERLIFGYDLVVLIPVVTAETDIR